MTTQSPSGNDIDVLAAIDTPAWHGDLGAARTAATGSGRLILAFLFAPTCGGCKRLAGATFPDPAVRELLADDVEAVHVNVRDEANEDLVEQLRQVWTPDFRILDEDAYDLVQWNGYLPPAEFVPQVLAALGRARLRRGEFLAAAELYDRVLTAYPTSAVAAEAGYYRTVSLMKEHKDRSLLATGFEWLRLHHPSSIWYQKASYVDDGLDWVGARQS